MQPSIATLASLNRPPPAPAPISLPAVDDISAVVQGEAPPPPAPTLAERAARVGRFCASPIGASLIAAVGTGAVLLLVRPRFVLREDGGLDTGRVALWVGGAAVIPLVAPPACALASGLLGG